MLHTTHTIETTSICMAVNLFKQYSPVIDALDLAMEQWTFRLAVCRRHVAGEVVPKNGCPEYLISLFYSAFRLGQYILLNDGQHALDFDRRSPQGWFLCIQDNVLGAIAHGDDGGRLSGCLGRRCCGLLYNVQCRYMYRRLITLCSFSV